MTTEETLIVIETPHRPATPPEDWPAFHLAHPGPGFAQPGDPNCAFYWNGAYHLHYIYRNDDGYAFAHVSSPDMVRWRWHPTTLTPSTMGHGMWSGTGFLTKEGRPAIAYHGAGPGDYFGYGLWMNQVAVATDDDLESWSHPTTIHATVHPGQDDSVISNWDPDVWLEGNTYYAIFGGHPGSGKQPTLLRSTDLEHWDFVGLFMDHDMPDVDRDEDVSCPNFFPLGDKHMLLCISHTRGCRYYIGEWTGERFIPERHDRMNWSYGALHVSDELNFFAPESVLTPDGRRVMWAWCVSPQLAQTGVQSLPRELALLPNGTLSISPLRELKDLRADERSELAVPVAAGEKRLITGLHSNAFEIRLLISNASASGQFGLEIYPDPDTGKGHTVCIDSENSTVSIGDVHAPFQLASEEPCLVRVFVDRNIIELFVNDRQALAALHPDSIGPGHVSLFSRRCNTLFDTVTTWSITPIYAESHGN